jgi:large subunit ribosomal protein L25
VSENTLAVEVRTNSGKGAARKLRAQGLVPAVVYGSGKEALALSLVPGSLESIVKMSDAGLNTLIFLDGDGPAKGKTVLIKELQRDPVRGTLVHADLLEIDMSQRISVMVPVHLDGEPEGVKQGGLLDHALREIEIECLPNAIPDVIAVNVAGLEVGDSIHVRDLEVAAGIVIRSQEGLSVASVVLPVSEVEETPAAGLEGEGEGEGEEAEGGKSEGAAGTDSAGSNDS